MIGGGLSLLLGLLLNDLSLNSASQQLRSDLYADVHECRVGVHIARNPSTSHLSDQLQCFAELLMAAALADDGGVCVNVAEMAQLMTLRQVLQPIK